MEKEIIKMVLEKLYDLTRCQELDYTSDTSETFEAFKSHMFEASQLISDLMRTIKLLEVVSK